MFSAPRALLGALITATALLGATSAQAQSRTFYLDRAQLSGAPDDGFMVWRPQMYERTRFYGTAALGFTLNPLRSETVADDTETAENIENPVQGQFITYLIAGTQLANRVSFNLAMPIAVYQMTGEDPSSEGVGGGFDVNRVALHDLRFDTRVRVYESNNRKLRFGAGAALWFPTGDNTSFTSDRQTSGMLFGSGEYDFGKFLITGMVGPHFRPARSVGGTDGGLFLGSDLRWAVGAFLPLRNNKIRLGAEVWGTTTLDADGPTSFERNTDIEWLAQGRIFLGSQQRTSLMAGAGTRIASGYGAPDVRVLASITHFLTLSDREPKSPGRKILITPDRDDYAQDSDKDGYPDDIDKCPTIPEDGKEPEPTDGCPTGSDRDGDGIIDAADACPDQAEDRDGFQDTDGCPEGDNDEDGIADAQDKCPKEYGSPNKDPEKHGCPLTRLVEGEGEVELLEAIQFESGKAVIKKDSYPIIDEVVRLLKNRADLRLGIYGHTDDVGGDATNLQLSKERAAAVRQYIIDKGVDMKRLESEGYGETKPVVNNNSPGGRAKNRRVEFKILDK
jgi:outer membrane protein OmpA-like peptidoglycan-associated protein